MSNLIITNALIIPMTDERRSFNGYVGTKDGVITEIGTGAPPKNTETERIIDASGCMLMPGLINAHTHLYQVLLRAVWEDLELMPWLKRIYGCARVLRPEHFYTGSLLGCVEAIRSGVTTVCEHNFLNPSAECAFRDYPRDSMIPGCARFSRARLWTPARSFRTVRKKSPSKRFVPSKQF